MTHYADGTRPTQAETGTVTPVVEVCSEAAKNLTAVGQAIARLILESRHIEITPAIEVELSKICVVDSWEDIQRILEKNSRYPTLEILWWKMAAVMGGAYYVDPSASKIAAHIIHLKKLRVAEGGEELEVTIIHEVNHAVDEILKKLAISTEHQRATIQDILSDSHQFFFTSQIVLVAMALIESRVLQSGDAEFTAMLAILCSMLSSISRTLRKESTSEIDARAAEKKATDPAFVAALRNLKK